MSRRSASVFKPRVVSRPEARFRFIRNLVRASVRHISTLVIMLSAPCGMARRVLVASKTTNCPFLRYQPNAQIIYANVWCPLYYTKLLVQFYKNAIKIFTSVELRSVGLRQVGFSRLAWVTLVWATWVRIC